MKKTLFGNFVSLIWLPVITLVFLTTELHAHISTGAQQPPDPNEFQSVENGVYRANPLFFEARSDGERCKATDLWLSSIRYEASITSPYNNRGAYFWQDGVLQMNSVNDEEMQAFATMQFRNIFGRDLPELSGKEVGQIAKSLKKCSSQNWVFHKLLPWVDHPRFVQNWAANFNSIERSVKASRVAEQERQSKEKNTQISAELGYPVGEIMKETQGYQLHKAFINNGAGAWCSVGARQAIVGLVFNGGENFKVENNDLYWSRFDNEVRPVIEKACPNVDKIYVLHYVKGFYINWWENSVQTYKSKEHGDVLSIAEYSTATGRRDWLVGTGLSNFVKYASSPSGLVLAFSKPSYPMAFEVVSISSLRDVMTRRRMEREAKTARAEADLFAARKKQYDTWLEQRRDKDRVKAADILRYYKTGAAEKMGFAGYNQSGGLQKIYEGDFYTFAGDYVSDADLSTSQFRNMMQAYRDPNLDRALKESWSNTAAAIDIAKQRLFLKMAYFTYHTVYGELCRANLDMSWDPNELTWRTLDRFGNVVEEGKPFSLPIRKPFKPLYNAIYENNIGENEKRTLLSSPSEFKDDFREFLKSEGCQSKNVRHFETNLYLANMWLAPVQILNKP